MSRVFEEETQIDSRIVRAVEDMGFETMSPIQEKAIPVMLTGQDMIGQAQTGTGKTAAFGIPLLQKVDESDRCVQEIVLCPTRELAMQVADEIRRLAKFMNGIKVLPIYGGQDIVRQIHALKGGVQIIIGTPGRVMDHMRRRTLRMDHVHTIVLDEADEMLNMGFREDIETILKDMPEEHQTVLFSATMPKPILDIARTYQKNAEVIRVVKQELTVPVIEQYYYEVKQRNKVAVLARLLDVHQPKLSLVFCNTKKQVDDLTESLKEMGYNAEGLHGDLKQMQRDRVMDSFRKGWANILVATDVAARGIDVDDVEAVFNYDLPQDDEYYVHRIGRTGRAGRSGKSFTLVVGKEIRKLHDIEHYCKTKIQLQKVPTLDDVRKVRTQKILVQAQQTIQAEDLEAIKDTLDLYLSEMEISSLTLAAALMKNALGEEAGEEQILDASTEQYRGKGSDKDKVRLFLNIGKKSHVKPGDILGAIAGETGMPGRMIGSIDMFDKFTFVDVPEKYAKSIIKKMKKAKIKGKKVNIEIAKA
ncbi:DEAD/DEAH box helicase [Anaerolentibacter hominis]|uniref:DEAD/DEAH box helicase n=1 Tax=Anaerolentibacter hominis TaxID=3079009 RepID=UPI0031B882FD